MVLFEKIARLGYKYSDSICIRGLKLIKALKGVIVGKEEGGEAAKGDDEAPALKVAGAEAQTEDYIYRGNSHNRRSYSYAGHGVVPRPVPSNAAGGTEGERYRVHHGVLH